MWYNYHVSASKMLEEGLLALCVDWDIIMGKYIKFGKLGSGRFNISTALFFLPKKEREDAVIKNGFSDVWFNV
jgi:hypothetical protein